MKRRSLRLRLLLAAAISISLALVLAGFGLVALFDRHVTRRVDAELHTFLNQIVAALEFTADGRAEMRRPLADPRFQQPYGGLYWQIVDPASGDMQRSRSLWDVALDLPPAAAEPGRPQIYDLAGPNGTTLRVYERRLTFERGAGQELRFAIAMEEGEIALARREFAAEIGPALVLLALVLTAAFWVQVNIGLKPLEAMRRAVQAVRTGQAQRLDAEMPDEIQPLVTEVNELLNAQEENVARARARAGDLAHGLKTPLTVLANDARKLRESGQGEIAGEIEQLVARMRRHVDHELARVRLAAHAGTRRPARDSGRADLLRAVTGLAEALKRSPKGETLTWELAFEAPAMVAIDPHDLTELLGNLMDNAMKWAREMVRVETAGNGAEVVIRILDDGPGVPPAALAALGERGLRLDEQVAGTGIGLAIARELLDAYGGSLILANRLEGGFSAEVRLRKAHDL
ncbi:signal transduction histidine kinase [Dongia mobilis]|uniref:histidine kinase n=1 Tax=Dongia mobilis TaxID=578943 RepID=A0A4R6WXM2_9PROT|nr:HAMP domain-containing sensor histidine kinase [Dongia mobilis]TDQ82355.1 signal transduction histidine kinase [Dongia mobilis]